MCALGSSEELGGPGNDGENKECHLHQETFPDSPGWASQCLAPNSFGQITEGYKR